MYNNFKAYKYGLKKGLPIGLGYFPVSLSFGFISVKGGLPLWFVVLVSLTNLTSTGQLAGVNLIINNATYIEILLNTVIINLRYSLMSLTLSQKTDDSSIGHRLLFSFGVTDEVFAVSSTETNYRIAGVKGKDGSKRLSPYYMYGLITLPYIGWGLGTLLGGLSSGFLPSELQNAMGIALYAMFIAIIFPGMRDSKPVFKVVILSIFFGCFIKYMPILNNISYGFRIIIATVLSAGICAYLFPVETDDKSDYKDSLTTQQKGDL